MFYDVGQGQGFQRNIVMNGSPHLPARVRQWYGDSRGRWEGDTLVDRRHELQPEDRLQGLAREPASRRALDADGADTLEYAVTIEDPTVWTRPWTVKQEFTRQNEKENRIYYEPRCHEGNYGLPAMLLAARLAEKAFAAGRGPHPATKDTATDFGGSRRIRSDADAGRSIHPARKETVMRIRLNGSMISVAVVAAAAGAVVSVLVTRTAGQASRPARIADKPNFSGIWQAQQRSPLGLRRTKRAPARSRSRASIPTSTRGCRRRPVLALGAAGGVPGSLGVVEGDGEIPYKPEALTIKKENGEELDRPRSRAQVLPAGHSARDVHAVPVPDRAGHEQDPHGVRVHEHRPARSTWTRSRGRRTTPTWAIRSAAGKATRWSST